MIDNLCKLKIADICSIEKLYTSSNEGVVDYNVCWAWNVDAINIRAVSRGWNVKVGEEGIVTSYYWDMVSLAVYMS